VIVPLHRLTPHARRCLETAVAVCGERDEVIAVSDQPVEGLPDGVRVLHTESAHDTSPAEKRDAAAAVARGEFCAFLDDDAYPAPDWIECALARFASDPAIAAIGGPGVTPPASPLRERVGGAFYESPFGSGALRLRFTPIGGVRDVDDWPAYNFFVRTQALADVGGWASRFYGGEDTKLCLALVQAGHRIVYDPEVVVYHFRRPVFGPHMRQVGNVGRHRGYFFRAYPETSRRPIFFAPAAALLAAPAVLAWASRRRGRAARVAALAAGGAGAISATALRDGADAPVAVLLPLALAAGHGAYGAGFLRGLATTEIESM
jgi:glycosyltransferase involved in cell wall biosynthesis